MQDQGQRLPGKVAVVTGSDSGIGQATAEALARAGADVCVVYHTDADGAGETRRRVEAAGRRAAVTQADVGDPASVPPTTRTLPSIKSVARRPQPARELMAYGIHP